MLSMIGSSFAAAAVMSEQIGNVYFCFVNVMVQFMSPTLRSCPFDKKIFITFNRDIVLFTGIYFQDHPLNVIILFNISQMFSFSVLLMKFQLSFVCRTTFQSQVRHSTENAMNAKILTRSSKSISKGIFCSHNELPSRIRISRQFFHLIFHRHFINMFFAYFVILVKKHHQYITNFIYLLKI